MDKYSEKTYYVLVVPSKVGAYVMSVGWSDVNTLEKLNRRRTKLFSKDQKQYLVNAHKIFANNSITKAQESAAKLSQILEGKNGKASNLK